MTCLVDSNSFDDGLAQQGQMDRLDTKIYYKLLRNNIHSNSKSIQ